MLDSDSRLCLAGDVLKIPATQCTTMNIHRWPKDDVRTLPLPRRRCLTHGEFSIHGWRQPTLNSVAMAAATRATRSSSQVEANANMPGLPSFLSVTEEVDGWMWSSNPEALQLNHAILFAKLRTIYIIIFFLAFGWVEIVEAPKSMPEIANQIDDIYVYMVT